MVDPQGGISTMPACTSCDIVNHKHRLFVTGIDTADPLVQPLPRMFGEKAFGSCARGATQQAQWTAGDVRENPIGDVGGELGQALLGDSRFFPENSLRMRRRMGVGGTPDFDPLGGASRTISSADLSSRRPLKAAARSSLSPVQPRYSIRRGAARPNGRFSLYRRGAVSRMMAWSR
jgi:hypothetical protein